MFFAAPLFCIQNLQNLNQPLNQDPWLWISLQTFIANGQVQTRVGFRWPRSLLPRVMMHVVWPGSWEVWCALSSGSHTPLSCGQKSSTLGQKVCRLKQTKESDPSRQSRSVVQWHPLRLPFCLLGSALKVLNCSKDSLSLPGSMGNWCGRRACNKLL